MNEELKIRVVLDTEGAKKQLDDVKGRAASAGGGGGGIGGAIGGGGFSGKLGIGAKALGAFGAAKAMVGNQITGPSVGGFGDIASEAFGGLGTQLENWVTGGKGAESRAASAAREATIGAFAQQYGRDGKLPEQAYTYRDQVYKWKLDVEKGRIGIETDPRMRAGGGASGMAKAIGEAIGGKFSEIVGDLVNKMSPVK